MKRMIEEPPKEDRGHRTQNHKILWSEGCLDIIQPTFFVCMMKLSSKMLVPCLRSHSS